MAFVKDFVYDIFISYAHVDNIPTSWENLGWIEKFYKEAKQEPAGLKVANRSRLLNVLLYNIPFKDWPSELSGTSGFPFHDAKEADDYGDPLDTGAPEFRNQLQNLRDAIIKLINDF